MHKMDRLKGFANCLIRLHLSTLLCHSYAFPLIPHSFIFYLVNQWTLFLAWNISFSHYAIFQHSYISKNNFLNKHIFFVWGIFCHPCVTLTNVDLSINTKTRRCYVDQRRHFKTKRAKILGYYLAKILSMWFFNIF